MNAGRLHPEIRKELDRLGLKGVVQCVKGRSKLYVGGQFVGLVSIEKRDDDRRGVMNVRAQLRRMAGAVA